MTLVSGRDPLCRANLGLVHEELLGMTVYWLVFEVSSKHLMMAGTLCELYRGMSTRTYESTHCAHVGVRQLDVINVGSSYNQVVHEVVLPVQPPDVGQEPHPKHVLEDAVGSDVEEL